MSGFDPADYLDRKEIKRNDRFVQFSIAAAEEETITVEKMALDENGFPQPTGEFETMQADSVVLALGQDVDLDLLAKLPGLDIDHGLVQVDDFQMTGRPGVFAGGDMTGGERTVTVAVGQGKRAARAIDAYLRGVPAQETPVSAREVPIARRDLLPEAAWPQQIEVQALRSISCRGDERGAISELLIMNHFQPRS